MHALCLAYGYVFYALLLAETFSMGPNGVFWSITIGESAGALLALAVFLRGKWKTQSV